MSIKMKALRSFGYGKVNEGAISRGSEFAVRDEHRAKELEAHGLAYRIDVKVAPKPQATTPDPVNVAVDTGPFVSVGGKTGAAEPPPSLPPVRQPRRRRSKNSGDDLLS